jgi:hypothetical protein
MIQLFSSGAIFGVILALMILEACVLIPYYQRTGLGIAPLPLLYNLLAGGGLLLAIAAFILKAPWACTGFALGLALIGHVADLSHRWQGERSRASQRHSTAKIKLNAEPR